MTYQEFNKTVQEIDNVKLSEMAKDILRKLCATGGQSFKMTVPPYLDDTDIILAEIIRRFDNNINNL